MPYFVILLIASEVNLFDEPLKDELWDELLHLSALLYVVLLVQHKTIDSVLARGEKLDSLVEKSSDLSAASQVNELLTGSVPFFHYICSDL